MSISLKPLFTALGVAALLAFSAVVASAQQTTGTVNMTATVSNYVELNSGGAVSLTGASGGSVTTDGTVNTPLAVVVNLGELGPSNTASYVKLSVPVKMRSNISYQLKMLGSVTGGGATAYSFKSTDVGFGMDLSSRASSLAPGTDTNATSGDPTTDAIADPNGRWLYGYSLGNFSSASEVLHGPRINKVVPATDLTGLVVPAIFAVKPQFYDPATSIAVSATFTITAP